MVGDTSNFHFDTIPSSLGISIDGDTNTFIIQVLSTPFIQIQFQICKRYKTLSVNCVCLIKIEV